MLNDRLPTCYSGTLASSFVQIMDSRAFNEVTHRMSWLERTRLWALRYQVLYGDAPQDERARNKSIVGDLPNVFRPRDVSSGIKQRKPPQVSVSGQSRTVTPPSWYDFAGRARIDHWATLRATMTPQVACETFCSEFLFLIEKYPTPGMIALVESALYRSAAAAATFPATGLSTSGEIRAPEEMNSVGSASQEPTGKGTLQVFCIRALQYDPAAVALLWLCRAYGIPCEVVLDSLTAAGPALHAGMSTTHQGYGGAASRMWVPPFNASLRFINSSGVGGECTAEVSDPLAAFSMLIRAFLAHVPHLSCHMLSVDGTQSSAFATSHTGREHVKPAQVSSAQQTTPPMGHVASVHGQWIDLMQAITRWLRDPLMALLVDAATREQQAEATVSSSSGPSLSADVRHVLEREALRKDASMSFHIFEMHITRSALQSEVTNSTGGMRCIRRPLTDSQAIVDVVARSFTQRMVSATDLYIASCAYILCTNPYCKDIFPLEHDERIGMSLWGCGSFYTVSSATTDVFNSGHLTESRHSYSTEVQGPPLSLPPTTSSVRLAGLPETYAKLVNQLVQGEEATAQARRENPIAVHSSVHGLTAATASSPCIVELPRVSCLTSSAAEAVALLITERMRSVETEGRRSRRQPCLILSKVFSDAWSLSQMQCFGFPFLLLDDRHGGVLLMEACDPFGYASQGGNGVTCGTGLEASSVLTTPMNATAGDISWEGLARKGWRTLSRILHREDPRTGETFQRPRVFRSDVRVTKAKL